jgi:NADH-quinone oxidoreductase subunit K
MSDLGAVPLLLLGAGLFLAGVACLLLRRHAIGILLGVELMLNAAALNFFTFALFNPAFALEGQVFALAVLLLAAVDAVLALAIVLLFQRHHGSADVDAGPDLKG